MHPSPRTRPIRRVLVATAVAAVSVAVLAAPATAHVEVVPGSAPRGADAILAFAVPNERDTATTVKIELALPTDRPIASVNVQPVPGWSWTTQTTKLTSPVKTDDGTVGEAVSKVTWTGGAIRPGELQLFTISAGPLPTKGKSVVFKVLQTYSDGEVVRWIETPTKGVPEPDFPAPTLKLTGKAKSG